MRTAERQTQPFVNRNRQQPLFGKLHRHTRYAPGVQHITCNIFVEQHLMTVHITYLDCWQHCCIMDGVATSIVCINMLSQSLYDMTHESAHTSCTASCHWWHTVYAAHEGCLLHVRSCWGGRHALAADATFSNRCVTQRRNDTHEKSTPRLPSLQMAISPSQSGTTGE